MSSIPEGSRLPPPWRISPAVAGFFSLAAFASLPALPLLGAFVALLAPLPLVHLLGAGRSSALGWGWVLLVLLGAALVWQAPWLVVAAVGYLVVAAWPAFATELWLRRPWSTGRWVALVAIAALGVFSLFLIAVFWPQPPAEALATSIGEATAEAAGTLRLFGTGQAGGEELAAWAAQVTAFLAPSLVAGYVLCSALWLRPRLPLLGLPRGEEPFSSYVSEDWLPVAFAVGGLGWVFAQGTAQWLAGNLFVTVLMLYLVHGLAVVFFHLGPRMGHNKWVRLAVIVLALQVPVALALSVVGIADSFFRLRRGDSKDEGSSE